MSCGRALDLYPWIFAAFPLPRAATLTPCEIRMRVGYDTIRPQHYTTRLV